MNATKPVRSRMSTPQRRDQILDVTRQVVDSEGFHAATIERIAQEAGITRTLIYQQFTNLSGLLVAMVDRDFQIAAKGLLEAMNVTPKKGEDRFLHTLAGIFKAVEKAPATWRMFLMPSEGGPPELYERLTQAVTFTRQFLNSSLEELNVEATPLASADRELTVSMVYAMGDELVRLYLQDPEKYPVERLLKQAEWFSGVMFQRQKAI